MSALPCPFCGSVDIEIGPTRKTLSGSMTWVGCNDCGARVFAWTADESEALAAWNRRAPDPRVAKLREAAREAAIVLDNYADGDDAGPNAAMRALAVIDEALAAFPEEPE